MEPCRISKIFVLCHHKRSAAKVMHNTSTLSQLASKPKPDSDWDNELSPLTQVVLRFIAKGTRYVVYFPLDQIVS